MDNRLKKYLILSAFSISSSLFLLNSYNNTYAYSTSSVSQATYIPLVEKPLGNLKVQTNSMIVAAQSSNDSYIASVGFSSQQGLNQWYYLQANGNSYTNMSWDSTNKRWKGTPAYTLVMSNAQHPDSQDSVRKWLSPRSGTIHITGTVKKVDTSYGDGVLVKVMKNQEQLWPSSGWQSIQYNDSKGYDLNVVTSVNRGDSIYFIVNKNITTFADTTGWDPVISFMTNTSSNEYNSAGRLTKMTLPDGKVIVFSYDSNGNVIKKTVQP